MAARFHATANSDTPNGRSVNRSICFSIRSRLSSSALSGSGVGRTSETARVGASAFCNCRSSTIGGNNNVFR